MSSVPALRERRCQPPDQGRTVIDGQGMPIDEPGPQLHRVQVRRDDPALPRGLAWAIAACALTFLVGLGLGTRLAPTLAPTPSASTLSALDGAQVSRALWTAYLNRGGEGWGLCLVAAEITCRLIAAVPHELLADFDRLPLTVSPQDWSAFSVNTVPAGHYVLAGPMTLLEPHLTSASVTADGVGTLSGRPLRPRGTGWCGPTSDSSARDVTWPS